MAEDDVASEVSNRLALKAEIERAFSHVTREGGVSWRETNVIDDYGSDAERKAARALETDKNWLEAVADPPWLHAWGSFSFLDPVGFRYYIGVAMARTIHDPMECADQSPEFALTVSDGHLQGYRLQQWSLIDEAQSRCIARFLEHMISVMPDEGWEEALQSYWFKFLQE